MCFAAALKRSSKSTVRMSWKAGKATSKADEEELEIKLGFKKDPAVEYIEASSLKQILESLVEATCTQLPDHFLDFAITWMRDSFAEQTSESSFAGNADQFVLAWQPLFDIATTAEGIHAYLEEQHVLSIVEAILQGALVTLPENVPSFVVDELASRFLQEQANRPRQPPQEPPQEPLPEPPQEPLSEPPQEPLSEPLQEPLSEPQREPRQEPPQEPLHPQSDPSSNVSPAIESQLNEGQPESNSAAPRGVDDNIQVEGTAAAPRVRINVDDSGLANVIVECVPAVIGLGVA
jgi:hypothetical protein